MTVFQPVEVCLWKSAILPPKDCAAVIRVRNLCEATFASVTAGRTWTVSAGLSVLFAFAWYTVFDAGVTVALHAPCAVDVTVRRDCCVCACDARLARDLHLHRFLRARRRPRASRSTRR